VEAAKFIRMDRDSSPCGVVSVAGCGVGYNMAV